MNIEESTFTAPSMRDKSVSQPNPKDSQDHVAGFIKKQANEHGEQREIHCAKTD
jgi:hypothetical protein